MHIYIYTYACTLTDIALLQENITEVQTDQSTDLHTNGGDDSCNQPCLYSAGHAADHTLQSV